MKRCATVVLLAFLTLSAVRGQGILSKIEQASDAQIQSLLSRYPAADVNRDGTLTREEALTYARAAMGGGAGKSASSAPAPTQTDVAYGPHPRNVLDFWKAVGEGPRPLVIFIHGGGFTGGDKSKWRTSPEIGRFLEKGISCAAINYRFRKDAPIQDILRDAARAVQFLRSRSVEWNLDPTRFAGWGGSAGAGTSLWLATRDDLADVKAEDLVLRESSRLQAVVLQATQATYDLTRWDAFLGPANPAWWQSPNEAAEFYHFKTRADLAKPEALPILRECDMLSWISPDDAPVMVSNGGSHEPSRDRNHYLHHPAHAREIEKACDAVGVRCVWLEGEKKPAMTDPVAFVLDVFEANSGATE